MSFSKWCLTIGLVVVVLVVAAGQGCTQEGGSGGGQSTRAMYIEDGADKYFAYQTKCPVCGEASLDPTHYVDVEGERIYFDKAECVKQFKDDRSTYLDKLNAKKKEVQEAYQQR